jgi:hypothetical protein
MFEGQTVEVIGCTSKHIGKIGILFEINLYPQDPTEYYVKFEDGMIRSFRGFELKVVNV